MINGKTADTKQPLGKRLKLLLLTLIVPFALMIIISLWLLASFNYDYTMTLQNANIASEFNFDFKYDLDLKMYYYIRGSNVYTDLPLSDVENAEEIFSRLQKTTTQSDNKWRIESLLQLCGKLRNCMNAVTEIEGYDNQIEYLELNIYSITSLIEKYLTEYINEEIRVLASIHQNINKNVVKTLIIMCVLAGALIIGMIIYSMRFVKTVTAPINELCKKAGRLGKGDFKTVPIATKSLELQLLDDGFNDMAVQIENLLERMKNDQDELRKTELELLQAQISPHFLYNTLDSIVWLAEAKRHHDVVQMVTSLSVFFRNSLNQGMGIIDLDAEINQVESYLIIQKFRYQDILQYEIDVDSEFLKYSIPKLTLQPIVENALYHGIKNKRGLGKITITAKEKNGNILLVVSDNGAGMTREKFEKLQRGIDEQQHEGLGLLNVHRRIKLYCGEEYGLSFASELGFGTDVTIRIPKTICENNKLSQ